MDTNQQWIPSLLPAIPVLPQYGIATSIAQFRDKNPHIRFSLEEIDGLNIIPALTERRFDLAFTRHNHINHEQFESLEICKDQLLVGSFKKQPVR